MFVFFDSAGDSAGGTMTVTLKRPTEGIGARLVKSWMVNLAGRLEAPMPLDFKEQPALHKAETEIYASHKDLAKAMEPDSPMKAIDSWEHAGLMVSAAPLTWVVLAPSGAHGVHHLTVETEAGAAAARQILARLVRGRFGAGHPRRVLRGSGDCRGGARPGGQSVGGSGSHLVAGRIRAERGREAPGGYAARRSGDDEADGGGAGTVLRSVSGWTGVTAK